MKRLESLHVAFTVVVLFIAFAATAYAGFDTVVAPAASPNSWTTFVDWCIDNLLKPALVIAIPGIVGLAIAALTQWLRTHGIVLDAARQKQFNDAAIKALEWATTQFLTQIETRGPAGWADPHLHDQIIELAKTQMIDKFPDAISNTVGSSASPERVDAVMHPVMTRLLPQVITEISSSPATPATPVQAAVPVVDVRPQP